jgi:hypothetical protein
MATIHRYKNGTGWYLVDKVGFFKYRINNQGQRVVDSARLKDGDQVPEELLNVLRNGHLYRLKRPQTPPLGLRGPFGPWP